MKKIGTLLVLCAVLSLLMCSISLTAFAEGAAEYEVYNDFSSEMPAVTTDSNGRGSIVVTADGDSYFEYAFLNAELMKHTHSYADISVGKGLDSFTYAVLDYDFAAAGELPRGMQILALFSDSDGEIISDSPSVALGAVDGVTVAVSDGDRLELGSDSAVWHHYTWIISTRDGAVASVRLYVDGEHFASFDCSSLSDATVLSGLRFDVPRGLAQLGEGFRLDNVRVRTYGSSYEGGLDNLAGTDRDLDGWGGNVFTSDYRLPAYGCEASLGGVYYATVGEALLAAEDGDTVTVYSQTLPILVDKAVEIVADLDLEYYSYTHVATRDGDSYTFTAATESDMAYVDWYVGYGDTADVAQRLAYTVGSIPVYYGSGIVGDVELDGCAYLAVDTVDGEGESVGLALSLDAGEVRVCRVVRKYESFAFELVDSIGRVDRFYGAKTLHTIFGAMQNGSTIRLLSDFDGSAAMISLPVYTGLELGFDLNGHTMRFEKKVSIFTMNNNGSTLNVYSSRPGARIFGKSNETNRNSNEGSCLASIGGDGVVFNIGAYGSYPGSNLSIYTPSLVDCTSGNGVVNIRGGNYYRNLNDWSGYLISREKAVSPTFNIDGARMVGTLSPVNFNLVAPNTTVNVRNSLIMATSTMRETANVCNNLSADSNLTFDNCIFGGIIFAASHVLPPSGTQLQGHITVLASCSFTKQPGGKYSYCTMPTGTVVRVNRRIPGEIISNDYGSDVSNINYNMITYTDSDVGCYAYAPTADDYSQIEWQFMDDFITEKWLNGEIPVPSFAIPEDTFTTTYVFDDVQPVDGYAIYSIRAVLNFTPFYSVTAYPDSYSINLYVPTDAVDLRSVGFAGAVFDLTSTYGLAIVEVNGTACYKLVQSGLKYHSATNAYKLNMSAYGSDPARSEYSALLSIDVQRYIVSIMEGSFTDTDKSNTKSFINQYCLSCDAIGATPLPTLKKYLE